ncbi:hypothetical protein BC832DRAFT_542165 [Gaertneriomyces semiglobifer]|nr:hypothetical protein BC832DRAFT_542165 [Gaertneriomyces semiglobifer]
MEEDDAHQWEDYEPPKEIKGLPAHVEFHTCCLICGGPITNVYELVKVYLSAGVLDPSFSEIRPGDGTWSMLARALDAKNTSLIGVTPWPDARVNYEYEPDAGRFLIPSLPPLALPDDEEDTTVMIDPDWSLIRSSASDHPGLEKIYLEHGRSPQPRPAHALRVTITEEYFDDPGTVVPSVLCDLDQEFPGCHNVQGNHVSGIDYGGIVPQDKRTLQFCVHSWDVPGDDPYGSFILLHPCVKPWMLVLEKWTFAQVYIPYMRMLFSKLHGTSLWKAWRKPLGSSRWRNLFHYWVAPVWRQACEELGWIPTAVDTRRTAAAVTAKSLEESERNSRCLDWGRYYHDCKASMSMRNRARIRRIARDLWEKLNPLGKRLVDLRVPWNRALDSDAAASVGHVADAACEKELKFQILMLIMFGGIRNQSM